MMEKNAAFFFNGKTIGKSLREVAVNLIKTETDDVVSRWYHGTQSTDLFTWVDRKQNIIKQQISFNGQVVEWNCLEGIKTGLIVESDFGDRDPKDPEKSLISESIQFDNAPQTGSVALALEIIGHMDIDEKFHFQLVDNFKNPQDIRTMPPKLFVERFGVALKNQQRTDASFWEAVKNRFQVLFNRR